MGIWQGRGPGLKGWLGSAPLVSEQLPERVTVPGSFAEQRQTLATLTCREGSDGDRSLNQMVDDSADAVVVRWGGGAKGVVPRSGQAGGAPDCGSTRASAAGASLLP